MNKISSLHMEKVFYYSLFVLSGFAGLIYESIWSHYLKLLLGHAAYAQSLVLAIFMGGMALGAWLIARVSQKINRVLLVYAVVELLLGLAALFFHRIFIVSTQYLYDSVFPELNSGWAIHTIKWGWSALLIFPQSVLLGMTFPLLCAALLRRWESGHGQTISTLYFANSFGAACGVLVSGFWLINHVGLPGTILTAGLINIFIALCVWQPAKSAHPAVPNLVTAKTITTKKNDTLLPIFLFVSLVTGFSSFLYEISWIRMLSLVLGSATHSFELMLAVFIFGLATGGWYIRTKIDRFTETTHVLAVVQILMGIFALISILIYPCTFDWMSWILEAVQRNDSGYVLYMLLNSLIVLLLMFPVTFCAGMTLPLLTHALLKNAYQEKSIGYVYSANTIGAILGIACAVHIGLPLLGLKGTLMTGGLIDIGLGILLVFSMTRWHMSKTVVQLMFASIVAFVLSFNITFDPQRMASGVFRHGRETLLQGSSTISHRDGKTATVSVYDTPSQTRVISTNGKPDASINVLPHSTATADEVTMILAAAIPLALRPEATQVANIGLGSALTTHTLLNSQSVAHVDTVEIERQMVEGAKHFMPQVAKAFTDPRSHIHIEDAKTFFASKAKRYHVIVSEPSNPWVSGVASLFTDEFYQHIKRYLLDEGLFVQWIQTYEINSGLVASVMKAVNKNFADYVIYSTDNANLLVVASPNEPVGILSESVFRDPEMITALKRIGISNLRDLQIQQIGSKRTLVALFESYPQPLNSDYFPYLDNHASQSRFLNENALIFSGLTTATLPLVRWLESAESFEEQTLSVGIAPVSRRVNTLKAEKILSALEGKLSVQEASDLPNEQALAVAHLLNSDNICHDAMSAALWLKNFRLIIEQISPYLSAKLASHMVAEVFSSSCIDYLNTEQKSWIDLYVAIANDNLPEVSSLAEKILSVPDLVEKSDADFGVLIASAMTSYLALDNPQAAKNIWEQYAAKRWQPSQVNIHLQLLLALANERSAQK